MSTIKLRRDTAANWVAADPILALGEPGLETDTGYLKCGDGIRAWSNLSYISSNQINATGGPGLTVNTDRGALKIGDSDVEPTGASHFHIRMDQNPSETFPGGIDLFFGDDSQFLRLANDGSVAVQARIGSSAPTIIAGAPTEFTNNTTEFEYGYYLLDGTTATTVVYVGWDGNPITDGDMVVFADNPVTELNNTFYAANVTTGTYVGDIVLYVDPGLLTPADPTGWSTPTAGGTLSSITPPGDAVLSGGADTTDLAYAGDAVIEGRNVYVDAGMNEWKFGSDGELTLSTGGHLGATKGGTMLDAGNGYNTSLTSYYSSGNYSSCVTANADGNLYITTYNDGGPNPSKYWQFGNDGSITFPDNTVQTTAYTGIEREVGYATILGDYTSYNSSFDAVCHDPNGNTYWAGSTDVNGPHQILVVKLDSTGAVLWEEVADYSFSNNLYGSAVQIQWYDDGSGGLLWVTAVGFTEGPNYIIELFINAADGSKNFSNAVSMPNVNLNPFDSDLYSPFAPDLIAATVGNTDGDVVTVDITGQITNGTTSTFDVLKTLVPNLTPIDSSDSFVVWSSGSYYISSVVEAVDPNYWTVTTFTTLNYDTIVGTVQLSTPKYTDALLMITTSSGITKAFSYGSDTATYEGYNATVIDGLNRFIYAVGYSEFPAVPRQSVISKFDTDGLAQWHKNINFDETVLDLTGVALMSDGSVIAVGYDTNTGNDGRVTRVAADGTVMWQMAAGYNNTGNPMSINQSCVVVDAQGNILTVWQYDSINSQDRDFYMVYFSPIGNIIWQRSIGTDQWDSVQQFLGLNFATADSTSFYIGARYEFGPGYDGAVAIKLPLDGSGIGTIGTGNNTWRYQGETWTWDSVNISGGDSDNVAMLRTEIDGNFVNYSDSSSFTVSVIDLPVLIDRVYGPGGALGFIYSKIQEGVAGNGGVTSITGLDGTGLSLTSDNYAQLMWVPNTTDVTINDIDSGGAVYNWAYVQSSGFIIKNHNTSTSHEWTFDTDGILQMPPGNETTAGWIQWTHADDDSTNTAGIGFVDHYNIYTGLGLVAPTDTNAAKGIWFGTPTDPTDPFRPETSMVFRGDTLYLPKNGYIKSHDFDDSGYPAIGTTGTSITIQTAETTSTQNNWTFGADGTLTLPDASILPTACGQKSISLNGDNLTIDLSTQTTTYNVMVVSPAIGYEGSDTHTILLGSAIEGQRLVIVNISTICALQIGAYVVPNAGPLQGTAEFIYATLDGTSGWIPLYGVTS